MKTPKEFKFTLEDISRITGLSVGNLRVMISRKLFNPNDLESVSKFIVGQILLEKSKRDLSSVG